MHPESAMDVMTAPVPVPDALDALKQPEAPPVRVIAPQHLRQVAQSLRRLFDQYKSDRQVVEAKWLKNLRQYLGIYDPEILAMMEAGRSRAYPRITRVKCISVLSRIMNLMFPGNERNWELKASPSADMHPEDVLQAVEDVMRADAESGVENPLTDEMVQAAVQRLAEKRAERLSTVLDDQLQEIGGDQTQDYVSLNRATAASGILYGLGVVRGPYARAVQATSWQVDAMGQPHPVTLTRYKPVFEVLPVWDYYPDMGAKNLDGVDGYFIRMVMSRAQVRALARRTDFLGDTIKEYLSRNPEGDYAPLSFETDLRTMGARAQVNERKTGYGKYEVLIWNGPLSGKDLAEAGAEVPLDQRADDIEAEVWMIGDTVIKADMNPWRRLGLSVKTIHAFVFDEDDTSPTGSGLADVVRDSQMSISAATRMLLDNASVVCGPNLELNADLLRADQDLSYIAAYKVWVREGVGQDATAPAVRNVVIESHIDELLKIVETFMAFADAETFVGPATGGDVARAPSEPMRTAAGASMLRGDAALPFKDVVRNFDRFTQSIITSLVQFNRKFNPTLAPEGDYNVIARGATSLIAKEVRGMQVDQLAATLSPEERTHVDERKLVEARFAVRDLKDLLVPADEAKRRQQAQSQKMAELDAQQAEMMRAEIRKTLADAYKGVAQGQKNTSNADATTVKAGLDLLEAGLSKETDPEKAPLSATAAPAAPAAGAATPPPPMGDLPLGAGMQPPQMTMGGLA